MEKRTSVTVSTDNKSQSKIAALENSNGAMPYIYWTKQKWCVVNTDYIYAIFSMWEENKRFINTFPLIYPFPYPSSECRIWARKYFVPTCKHAQMFALEKDFNLTLTLHLLLVLVIITEQKCELVFSVMEMKQNSP